MVDVPGDLDFGGEGISSGEANDPDFDWAANEHDGGSWSTEEILDGMRSAGPGDPGGNPPTSPTSGLDQKTKAAAAAERMADRARGGPAGGALDGLLGEDGIVGSLGTELTAKTQMGRDAMSLAHAAGQGGTVGATIAAAREANAPYDGFAAAIVNPALDFLRTTENPVSMPTIKDGAFGVTTISDVGIATALASTLGAPVPGAGFAGWLADKVLGNPLGTVPVASFSLTADPNGTRSPSDPNDNEGDGDGGVNIVSGAAPTPRPVRRAAAIIADLPTFSSDTGLDEEEDPFEFVRRSLTGYYDGVRV